MRKKAILDSGFLYATIDIKDRNHLRVTQALPTVTEQILLPVPVLVEVSYLLSARIGHSAMRQCVRQLADSPIELLSILPSDLPRIHELLEQYADLKLDFTDAAIVTLAERLDIQKILTVDLRDFGTIRPKHCPHFDIIPA
ncbi:type II toxin-antitoxin system VapC family toxin [Candidatus Electronema sp. PJ]|uniref:type II toxin-antitoxin system VapC family toxin n=1 Tax=Candidatus Electronema sp. PJ TaxID=3401572 RepID=UPI003AA8613D